MILKKTMDLQEKIDLVPNILKWFDEAIYGQKLVKDDIVKWFLSNEHILIEALPWLWKTELIKTLAKSSWLDYKRIQGTPDLMPQDIMWYTTISWKKIKWPIETNILLVDEINRINPKTLSALLSAMSERIIVDIDTWEHIPLPKNFTVVATQNPSETIWTFDLPEAVKDRFAIKVKMKKEKWILLKAYKINEEDIPCNISNNLYDLISKIFDNLEPNFSKFYFIKNNFENGPSIRSGLQFIKIVKVTAFINARDFVILEDIISNIIWVFEDKIILKDEFDYWIWNINTILEEFMKNIDNL